MASGPAIDQGGNDGAAGAEPTNGRRVDVAQASDVGSAEAGAGDGRFRGVTELSLDAKGRLAIPARHRDGLVNGSGGELVVTADPGGCLLIFPRLTWEPLQQRLMSFSSFNETVRRLQRLLVGHADDVEIDAAGRILVPPALRRYASLDKHVVLVGQGRKLELWDATRWQGETAQAIALPAELPTDLAGFSL